MWVFGTMQKVSKNTYQETQRDPKEKSSRSAVHVPCLLSRLTVPPCSVLTEAQLRADVLCTDRTERQRRVTLSLSLSFSLPLSVSCQVRMAAGKKSLMSTRLFIFGSTVLCARGEEHVVAKFVFAYRACVSKGASSTLHS